MLTSRLFARSGATVSVAAHLAALGLILGFSGVRPFASIRSQAIAVDIVTPDEALTPPKQPTPEIPLPMDKPTAVEKAPTPPPAAAATQAQALPAAATPADPPKSPVAQVPPEPAAVSSSTPAQAEPPPPSPPPDLSVKYHVNFGLTPRAANDDFDAAAARVSKIDADDVAKFRERLRSCSTLPGGVDASDKIRIVVRAEFAPDGRLVKPPFLIEASASAKGPALMRAAIDALQACQPYTTLPAAKYDQWKVLDLSFTPQDFSGG